MSSTKLQSPEKSLNPNAHQHTFLYSWPHEHIAPLNFSASFFLLLQRVFPNQWTPDDGPLVLGYKSLAGHSFQAKMGVGYKKKEDYWTEVQGFCNTLGKNQDYISVQAHVKLRQTGQEIVSLSLGR